MNTFKKSLVAVVLASAGAAAQAEVSGSVGVASMYLWRGLDLGGGAAVSGSLDYSHESGFYAGIWGSSGDATGGQEYDLYAGWGGAFGDFGVDLSYWDYNYPSFEPAGGYDAEDLGLGLSYGDFSFTWLHGLDEIEGQEYYLFSFPISDFTLSVGHLDNEELGGGTGTHFDVSYGYTDNLSFTVSMSSDDGAGYSEEALFVVGYSIPLEM